MKTRDWYLTCLMEECFEIILEAQDVAVTVDPQWPFRSTSLSQEMADLVGAFALLTDRGILVGDAACDSRIVNDKYVDLCQRLSLDTKEGTKAGLRELIAALSHLGMRVSKALRFGLAEVQPGQSLDNARRIVDAYSQVLGVAVFLNKAGCLTLKQGVLMPASKAKMAKVDKFLGYAREVGAVED